MYISLKKCFGSELLEIIKTLNCSIEKSSFISVDLPSPWVISRCDNVMHSIRKVDVRTIITLSIIL